MCNVGKIDKIIRILIALALFAGALLTPYWWLGLIGVVALMTAIFGFCPLYALLGMNSGCENKENKENKES